MANDHRGQTAHDVITTFVFAEVMAKTETNLKYTFVVLYECIRICSDLKNILKLWEVGKNLHKRVSTTTNSIISLVIYRVNFFKRFVIRSRKS